jgi:hypothetical protein
VSIRFLACFKIRILAPADLKKGIVILAATINVCVCVCVCVLAYFEDCCKNLGGFLNNLNK